VGPGVGNTWGATVPGTALIELVVLLLGMPLGLPTAPSPLPMVSASPPAHEPATTTLAAKLSAMAEVWTNRMSETPRVEGNRAFIRNANGFMGKPSGRASVWGQGTSGPGMSPGRKLGCMRGCLARDHRERTSHSTPRSSLEKWCSQRNMADAEIAAQERIATVFRSALGPQQPAG
jgi:hypothetical protein